MRTTERIRRPVLVEPIRNLPVTLVSLFIVMAGVDVLLVMQPSLVHSLRDDWQSWVHGSISAPWATLVGATATVAGFAIAAGMLTLVVRGIADSPYLWLSSTLVAGCCFAISQIPVEVPVRMPTPAFAGMSALLLFGGGAFFQSRAALFNMTGVFLTSTPLALLGVGYLRARTSSGAPYVIDSNAQLLMSLLFAASAGVVLISVAARRLRAMGGSVALNTQSDGQLAELVERARENEQRAVEAEYRLEHLLQQGGGSPRLLEEDEFGRKRRSGRWGLWLFFALVIGGGAAAYIVGYLPIESQLATQRRLNHEQSAKHETAIAALRTELDRTRQEQEAAKAAAAAQPPAAPVKGSKKKSVEAAAVPAEAPAAAKPAPSEKPAPVAKPAAAAKPAPSEAAPPKPAAVEKEKPAPAAKPAAAKPAKPAGMPPEDRALISNGDDPLEGLDGM